MHDEAAAIEEIKSLSINAKSHLGHYLRNGLMNIISSDRRGQDLEEEVVRLEARLKEMGL